MAALDLDSRVRLEVYRHFVRFGLAPTAGDLGDELGASPSAIADSFERLAAAHVLVLDPATRGLWMAMPFSAVPTRRRMWLAGVKNAAEPLARWCRSRPHGHWLKPGMPIGSSRHGAAGRPRRPRRCSAVLASPIGSGVCLPPRHPRNREGADDAG